jgi:hypothetical protein
LDTLTASKTHVEEKNIPWMSITDSHLDISYRNYYGMTGIPTTVVIDCASGKIIEKMDGYLEGRIDWFLPTLDWAPPNPPEPGPTVTETTYDESSGTVTVTWTDLGPDYIYTVYKAGRTVISNGSVTSYVDNKLPATGIEGYAIMAYNTATRDYTNLVTTVAWTTAPPLAITNHEVMQDGKVKLTWHTEPGMLYSVFRAGRNVSGSSYLTSGEWIDNSPLPSNDYMLIALYKDGTAFKTTFSNLYKVTKPAQGFASSANALDKFWSEYGRIQQDDWLMMAE